MTSATVVRLSFVKTHTNGKINFAGEDHLQISLIVKGVDNNTMISLAERYHRNKKDRAQFIQGG